MKIAIAGSRGLEVSCKKLKSILPENTKLIISGGAKGIDSCAPNMQKSTILNLKNSFLSITDTAEALL